MFKVLKSEVYSHLYTVNTIFKKLFYSRTIKSTQTKFIYIVYFTIVSILTIYPTMTIFYTSIYEFYKYFYGFGVYFA